MSVLAHIVLDGRGLAPEPAATKAFAYILNSDRAAAQAFVSRILGELDIGHFDLGPVDSEIDYEGRRPDLVIHDTENRRRLIVEFKFWAGLTENQPVAYLDLLPEDEPSALLFVVPEQRIAAVWRKVRDRCEAAGLELGEEPDGQAMTWARVAAPDGNRVLAIASWEHIFEHLIQGVVAPGTRSDIDQLQRLTQQVTRRLMVPTALIVWWYGPYQGIEEFHENVMDGAQLYMAVPDHEPPYVGATANADEHVQFDVDAPGRDETFLALAANGSRLYVGELTPIPAGGAGLAAAAAQAANALRHVLRGLPAADDPPDGFVSLFSSFYEGALDEAINDYPCAAPPSGFPIVIAFNPFPEPADHRNWSIVRVPRFS